jgi:hypothetical protein
MNENSLKNLELANPENNFNNSEVARMAQQKSVAKRKENKLLKEVAAEKLLKKFNGVSFQDLTLDKLLDYCKKEGAEPETVLKILTFLRDTSGQKPKEEVQAVCMPIINIKGL